MDREPKPGSGPRRPVWPRFSGMPIGWREPFEDLLVRTDFDRGPQERRDPGGGDCAGAGREQHQSPLHFVAQAPWSDQALSTRVRELVLPSITHDEPIPVWTLDDTGFPKKGSHSVGGDPAILRPTRQTRELSGGRQLVGSDPSGRPAGGVSADLPKDWADDPGRRAAAGVPEDIAFQTKPEIALRQMRQAHADGLPAAAVALMDPGYGNDAELRAGITELEQPYVAGILPTTSGWRPGDVAAASALVGPRPAANTAAP